MAESYTANSRGTFKTTDWINSSTLNQTIPYAGSGTLANTLSVTKPSGSNNVVEFVRVRVQFAHAGPKFVGLRLISPQGTVTNILQPLTNNNSYDGSYVFEIGVNAFYGEQIEGNWIIGANDYYNDGVTGTLTGWGIQVYGN